MKLSDLDGQLYKRMPDGSLLPVSAVDTADVLYFQCPKCAAGQPRGRRDDGRGYVEGVHFISVPFAAHDGLPAMPTSPVQGGARWTVTGKTLADVSTQPSIAIVGGCAWHGYVTNGELVTC